MNLASRGAFLAAFLALPLLAQDAKKQDDVLQRRDGGFLVGKVLRIEGDSIEILVQGEKESRRISARDIQPYSLYKVRLDRVDKGSASARLDLGEFCMANGLYAQAAREFEEAAKDPAVADKAKKRRDDANNEDARAKFEEAKKHAVRKEWDEAIKLLHIVIERYESTPYHKDAKDLQSKIADEIKADNEAKKAQLAKKKEEEQNKVAQAQQNVEADLFARTVALIEEAQKAWGEGLDAEAKNLTKADKAWKAAEFGLLAAKRNVEVMLKSNDVDVIKKAKELDKQADHWLVRTYYRLGRMFAVELNYPTALEWLNRALKVPHDEQMDRYINEVVLTISQLKMKERAAGRGY
jgi:tetratricopeptide (TPR) repeat protein